MHFSKLVVVLSIASAISPVCAMAAEADGCAIPTLKASLTMNSTAPKQPAQKTSVASPAPTSAYTSAPASSSPNASAGYNTSALYKITTAHRPVQRPTMVAPKSTSTKINDNWHADPRRVAAVAAMLNQYKNAGPTSHYSSTRNFASETRPVVAIAPPAVSPVAAAAGAAQAANSDKLPRWGDKNCSCHEAGRLFGEHKFIEAAAMYRKTGDNMMSAWGHPTKDIGNARRGEAVSYAAAGNINKARDLYCEAVEMYISSVKGNAPGELQQSIVDLSEIYKKAGDKKRSDALRLAALRICALSRVSPAMGDAEFRRIMQ